MQNNIEIPWYNIQDIGFLSKEEAEKLPKDILKFSWWWWLSSPGTHSSFISYVNHVGDIDDFGAGTSANGMVRPAITVLNLDNYGLKVGDQVSALGDNWLYIGNNKALLKSDVFPTKSFEEANQYINDWLSHDVFNEYPISTYSVTFYMDEVPLKTVQTDKNDEVSDIIADYLGDNQGLVDSVEIYNSTNYKKKKFGIDQLI